MSKREFATVSLSIVVGLFLAAPALAVIPYTSFSQVYDFVSPWASGNWTEFNNSGAVWDNSVSGFLSYSSSHTDMYAQWVRNPAPGDPVGAATDWTFEVKAKVTAQGAETGSATGAPAGLYMGIMNSAKKLTELVVQSSSVQLRTAAGWVTLSSSTNSDVQHAIRLTRNAAGEVKVWRDETQLGGTQTTADGTGIVNAAYTSVVIFGDRAYAAGATDGLSATLDYVAYDIGHAYDIPEPASMLVMALGSLAYLLRKRS